MECSVFDAKTKKHYDLSKLSSNHGWQAVNKNRKYYMNVCRPLFKRPRGCSVFSAICDVQVQSNGTETFIQDLGRKLSFAMELSLHVSKVKIHQNNLKTYQISSLSYNKQTLYYTHKFIPCKTN